MNTAEDCHSENSVPTFCSICGDKATGKHYGANSCDGCKGFFRRSVRKNHHYTCTFNRACLIDRDKRNQCRYCRLKKCFKSGMRKEAVQTERDKISSNRSTFEDFSSQSYITMAQLQNAELVVAQERKPCADKIRVNQLAELDDVCESMREQLLLLVNWAKSLPCFGLMSLDDQIALLRGHAGEMLILGVVWRSLVQGQENSLVLGNNLIIAPDSNDPDISDVARQILNLLCHPMNYLELEEIEIASFKAIIFFDPSTRYLTDNSRQLARACRSQIQVELMNYMNDKQYTNQGRFGELMLLLSDLRAVTQIMVQKVKLAKMMGFAKIDSLLSETLLSSLDNEQQNTSYYSNQFFHQPNNPFSQSSGCSHNIAQPQNGAYYDPVVTVSNSSHITANSLSTPPVNNHHILSELQSRPNPETSFFPNEDFSLTDPYTNNIMLTNPTTVYSPGTSGQDHLCQAQYASNFQPMEQHMCSHLHTNLHPSSFSPHNLNDNSESFNKL